jgi:hypothetical protein
MVHCVPFRETQLMQSRWAHGVTIGRRLQTLQTGLEDECGFTSFFGLMLKRMAGRLRLPERNVLFLVFGGLGMMTSKSSDSG